MGGGETDSVFESTPFPESSHVVGNWQGTSVHTKLGSFTVGTGSIPRQDGRG